MKRLALVLVIFLISASAQQANNTATPAVSNISAAQRELDRRFMMVPDPKLAEQHLKTLTQAPHIAGSPEDKATADYVAEKFRAAGLDTQIVEYKVWLNLPKDIRVTMLDASGQEKLVGPTREHVDGDPFDQDPRVVMPFNGSSPSGDVQGEAVYANYGRPEDFKKLEEMKIDVRGKIVIVRYGANFRGVKSYIAEQHGAAGVIIYSDPIDDGYFKGDAYPKGPWRPATGVQRGSVQYMFKYPGDATTPGIAALPDLPEAKRTPPAQATDLPKIPTTPLSYGDAATILQSMGGPESPREWQGALPFTYHVGPGAKVRLQLKQDFTYTTIWDVIGKIRGSQFPDEWVLGGNHRDAWVYGAVDPNSGTAAMLETVHGLGELLRSGWKPKRTIVLGSWDAEEQGLIGSTEWGEQNEADMPKAVAYFNMDVGVSGPNFGSSAVPTLKQFVRDVTKGVPSPKGGTVYQVWKAAREKEREGRGNNPDITGSQTRRPNAQVENDVPIGDLGSGSDYTVFLQHLGVPASDIGSTGNYGVYHSVFDNFNWFKKFGDPDFIYEQQMARVFGLELLHMAQADALPYDYTLYGREISAYIESAKKKAADAFAGKAPSFERAEQAAKRFTDAGGAIAKYQKEPPADVAGLNHALRAAELALLLPEGLPKRPWFKHAIYAPGEYTGYAAVVIPGVNGAIDDKDAARTAQQIDALASALERAAKALEDYHPGAKM